MTRVGLALVAFALGCSSQDGGADASSDVAVDVHQEPLDAGADVIDAAFERPPLPQVPLVQATMKSPTLVTILASNEDMPAELATFSGAVPQSKFWTSIATEYQLGTITPAATLTGPAMTGAWSLAQLSSYVSAALQGTDGGLAPNGNTIYLVYLPSAAAIGGTLANDCGYHTSYPTGGSSVGDQMAVVQRCKPYGAESSLDPLTITASHEIAESATDPLGKGYTLGTISQTPWTHSVWQALAPIGQIELGDLCEGTRIYEAADGGPDGGFAYQRTWSNQGAASGGDPCTPPAAAPYESIAAPKDWFAATPGKPLTIPIEGWAIAPAKPWLLYADWTTGTQVFTTIAPSAIDIATQIGVGSTGNCYAREWMSTTATGTITVDVPYAAKSGDFGVLYVDSFREDNTCYPPLTEDAWHASLVGIYVP